jgi:hypothetical protein
VVENNIASFAPIIENAENQDKEFVAERFVDLMKNSDDAQKVRLTKLVDDFDLRNLIEEFDSEVDNDTDEGPT